MPENRIGIIIEAEDQSEDEFQQFANRLENTEELLGDFNKAAVQVTSQIEKTGRSIRDTGNTTNTAGTQIEQASRSVTTITEAVANVSTAIKTGITQIKEISDEVDTMGEEMGQTSQLVSAYETTMSNVSGELDKATEASERLNQFIDETGLDAAKATGLLKGFNDLVSFMTAEIEQGSEEFEFFKRAADAGVEGIVNADDVARAYTESLGSASLGLESVQQSTGNLEESVNSYIERAKEQLEAQEEIIEAEKESAKETEEFTDAQKRAADALGEKQQQTEKASESGEKYTEVTEEAAKSEEDYLTRLNRLAMAIANADEETEDLSESLTDYDKSVDKAGKSTGDTVDEIIALSDEMEESDRKVDEAFDAVDDYDKKMEEFLAGAESGTDTVEKLNAATGESTEESKRASQARQEQTDEIQKSIDAVEAEIRARKESNKTKAESIDEDNKITLSAKEIRNALNEIKEGFQTGRPEAEQYSQILQVMAAILNNVTDKSNQSLGSFNRAQKTFKELSDASRDLNSIIVDGREDSEEYTEAVERHEKALAATETSIKRYEGSLKRLTTEKNKATKVNELLNQLIGKTGEEFTGTNGVVSSFTTALEKLDNNITDNNNNIEYYKNNINDLDRAHHIINNTIHDAIAGHTNISNAIDTARESTEKLTGSNNESNQSINQSDEVIEEKTEALNKNTEATDKNTEAQQDLDKANEIVVDGQQQTVESEKEIAEGLEEVNQAINQVIQQKTNLNKETQDLAKSQETLNDAFEKIAKELNITSPELEKIRDRFFAVLKTIGALSSNVDTAESVITGLSTQITETGTDAAESEAHIQEYRDTIENLSLEHAEAIKVIADLNKEINSAGVETTDTTKAFRDIDDLLERLKQRIDENRQSIDAYEDNVEGLRGELIDAEGALAEFEDEVDESIQSVDKITETTEQFQSNIADTQKEIRDIISVIAKLTGQTDEYIVKLLEQSNAQEKAGKATQESATEVTNSRRALNQAATDVVKSDTDISTSNEKVAAVVKLTGEQFEAAQKQIRETGPIVDTISKIVDTLVTDLLAARETFSGFTSSVSNFGGSLPKTRNELSNYDKAINAISQQIKTAITVGKNLNEIIDDTGVESGETQTTLNQYLNTLGKLDVTIDQITAGIKTYLSNADQFKGQTGNVGRAVFVFRKLLDDLIKGIDSVASSKEELIGTSEKNVQSIIELVQAQAQLETSNSKSTASNQELDKSQTALAGSTEQVTEDIKQTGEAVGLTSTQIQLATQLSETFQQIISNLSSRSEQAESAFRNFYSVVRQTGVDSKESTEALNEYESIINEITAETGQAIQTGKELNKIFELTGIDSNEATSFLAQFETSASNINNTINRGGRTLQYFRNNITQLSGDTRGTRDILNILNQQFLSTQKSITNTTAASKDFASSSNEIIEEINRQVTAQGNLAESVQETSKDIRDLEISQENLDDATLESAKQLILYGGATDNLETKLIQQAVAQQQSTGATQESSKALAVYNPELDKSATGIENLTRTLDGNVIVHRGWITAREQGIQGTQRFNTEIQGELVVLGNWLKVAEQSSAIIRVITAESEKKTQAFRDQANAVKTDAEALSEFEKIARQVAEQTATITKAIERISEANKENTQESNRQSQAQDNVAEELGKTAVQLDNTAQSTEELTQAEARNVESKKDISSAQDKVNTELQEALDATNAIIAAEERLATAIQASNTEFTQTIDLREQLGRIVAETNLEITAAEKVEERLREAINRTNLEITETIRLRERLTAISPQRTSTTNQSDQEATQVPAEIVLPDTTQFAEAFEQIKTSLSELPEITEKNTTAFGAFNTLLNDITQELRENANIMVGLPQAYQTIAKQVEESTGAFKGLRTIVQELRTRTEKLAEVYEKLGPAGLNATREVATGNKTLAESNTDLEQTEERLTENLKRQEQASKRKTQTRQKSNEVTEEATEAEGVLSEKVQDTMRRLGARTETIEQAIKSGEELTNTDTEFSERQQEILQRLGATEEQVQKTRRAKEIDTETTQESIAADQVSAQATDEVTDSLRRREEQSTATTRSEIVGNQTTFETLTIGEKLAATEDRRTANLTERARQDVLAEQAQNRSNQTSFQTLTVGEKIVATESQIAARVKERTRQSAITTQSQQNRNQIETQGLTIGEKLALTETRTVASLKARERQALLVIQAQERGNQTTFETLTIGEKLAATEDRQTANLIEQTRQYTEIEVAQDRSNQTTQRRLSLGEKLALTDERAAVIQDQGNRVAIETASIGEKLTATYERHVQSIEARIAAEKRTTKEQEERAAAEAVTAEEQQRQTQIINILGQDFIKFAKLVNLLQQEQRELGIETAKTGQTQFQLNNILKDLSVRERIQLYDQYQRIINIVGDETKDFNEILHLYTQISQRATTETGEFTAQSARKTQALRGQAAATRDDQKQLEILDNSLDQASKSTKDLTEESQKKTKAVKDQTEATAEDREELNKLDKSLNEAGKSTQGLTEESEKKTRAVRDQSNATKDDREELDRLGKSLDDAERSSKGVTEESKKKTRAIRDQTDATKEENQQLFLFDNLLDRSAAGTKGFTDESNKKTRAIRSQTDATRDEYNQLNLFNLELAEAGLLTTMVAKESARKTKAIRQQTSATQKETRALDGLGKAAQAIIPAARDIRQNFELAEVVFERFSRGILEVIDSQTKLAIDLEKTTVALETISGSASAAAKQYERLVEVARAPGLNFEQALKGSVQLQAIGLEGEQAARTLGAFGNALALAGQSASELDQIVNAIRQMNAEGKILQEDLSIMTTRVAVLTPLLRDLFGGTRAEDIRAYYESMDVAADQAKRFTAAITLALEQLPDASETTANALENLSDTFKRINARVGQSFTPIIKFATTSVEGFLLSIENNAGLLKTIAALETASLVLIGLTTALAAGTIAVYAFREAINLLLRTTFGKYSLILIGITAAISTLSILLQKTETQIDSWNKQIDSANKFLVRYQKNIKGANAEILKLYQSFLENEITALEASLSTAIERLIQLETQAASTREELEKDPFSFGSESFSGTISLREQSKEIQELRAVIKGMADELAELKKERVDINVGIKTLQQINKLRTGIRELKEELEEETLLDSIRRSLSGENIDLDPAITALSDVVVAIRKNAIEVGKLEQQILESNKNIAESDATAQADAIKVNNQRLEKIKQLRKEEIELSNAAHQRITQNLAEAFSGDFTREELENLKDLTTNYIKFTENQIKLDSERYGHLRDQINTARKLESRYLNEINRRLDLEDLEFNFNQFFADPEKQLDFLGDQVGKKLTEIVRNNNNFASQVGENRLRQAEQLLTQYEALEKQREDAITLPQVLRVEREQEQLLAEIVEHYDDINKIQALIAKAPGLSDTEIASFNLERAINQLGRVQPLVEDLGSEIQTLRKQVEGQELFEQFFANPELFSQLPEDFAKQLQEITNRDKQFASRIRDNRLAEATRLSNQLAALQKRVDSGQIRDNRAIAQLEKQRIILLGDLGTELRKIEQIQQILNEAGIEGLTPEKFGFDKFSEALLKAQTDTRGFSKTLDELRNQVKDRNLLADFFAGSERAADELGDNLITKLQEISKTDLIFPFDISEQLEKEAVDTLKTLDDLEDNIQKARAKGAAGQDELIRLDTRRNELLAETRDRYDEIIPLIEQLNAAGLESSDYGLIRLRDVLVQVKDGGEDAAETIRILRQELSQLQALEDFLSDPTGDFDITTEEFIRIFQELAATDELFIKRVSENRKKYIDNIEKDIKKLQDDLADIQPGTATERQIQNIIHEIRQLTQRLEQAKAANEEFNATFQDLPEYNAEKLGITSFISGLGEGITTLITLGTTADVVLGKIQDRIAETTAAMKEAEGLRETISKSASQAEIANIVAVAQARADALDQSSKDYQKLYDAFIRIVKQGNDKIIDLQKDLRDRIEDIAEDITDTLIDTWVDARDAQREYNDEAKELAEEQYQDQKDLKERFTQLFIDSLDEEQRAQEEHYDNLLDLAEDHERNLEDLYLGRNRNIQDENIDRNRAIEDADTELARDELDIRQNLADELEKIDNDRSLSHLERLKARGAAEEKARKDLRDRYIEYNRTREDIDKDYNRNRTDIERDYGRDVIDAETDLARDKEDANNDLIKNLGVIEQKRYADRLTLLEEIAKLEAQHRADELELEEQHAESRKGIFTGIINHYISETGRYLAGEGIKAALDQSGATDAIGSTITAGLTKAGIGTTTSGAGTAAGTATGATAGTAAATGTAAAAGTGVAATTAGSGTAAAGTATATGAATGGAAATTGVVAGLGAVAAAIPVFAAIGELATAIDRANYVPYAERSDNDFRSARGAGSFGALTFDENIGADALANLGEQISTSLGPEFANIDANKFFDSDGLADSMAESFGVKPETFTNIENNTADEKSLAENQAKSLADIENETSETKDYAAETADYSEKSYYTEQQISDQLDSLGKGMGENTEEIRRTSSLTGRESFATLAEILGKEPDSSPLRDFLENEQGILRVFAADKFNDGVDTWIVGNEKYLKDLEGLLDNTALDRDADEENAFLQELSTALAAAGLTDDEQTKPLLEAIATAFDQESIDISRRAEIFDDLRGLFQTGTQENTQRRRDRDATSLTFVERLKDLLDNVTARLSVGSTITVGEGSAAREITLLANTLIRNLETGESRKLQAGEELVLKDGEVIELDKDEYIDLANDQFITLARGEYVQLEEGTVVRLADDEFITLAMGEAVHLAEGAVIELAKDQYVQLQKGAFVSVDPNYAKSLGDSLITRFNSDAKIKIPADALVKVDPNSKVELKSDQTVTLASGQTVTLASGETISLPAGATIDLATKTVKLATGETIELAADQTVKLADKQTVTLATGETIELAANQFVTIKTTGDDEQPILVGVTTTVDGKEVFVSATNKDALGNLVTVGVVPTDDGTPTGNKVTVGVEDTTLKAELVNDKITVDVNITGGDGTASDDTSGEDDSQTPIEKATDQQVETDTVQQIETAAITTYTTLEDLVAAIETNVLPAIFTLSETAFKQITQLGLDKEVFGNFTTAIQDSSTAGRVNNALPLTFITPESIDSLDKFNTSISQIVETFRNAPATFTTEPIPISTVTAPDKIAQLPPGTDGNYSADAGPGPRNMRNMMPLTVNLLDNTVSIAEGQKLTVEPGTGTFKAEITNTVPIKTDDPIDIQGMIGINHTVDTKITNPVTISGPVTIATNSAIPVSVQGQNIDLLKLYVALQQTATRAGLINTQPQ